MFALSASATISAEYPSQPLCILFEVGSLDSRCLVVAREISVKVLVFLYIYFLSAFRIKMALRASRALGHGLLAVSTSTRVARRCSQSVSPRKNNLCIRYNFLPNRHNWDFSVLSCRGRAVHWSRTLERFTPPSSLDAVGSGPRRSIKSLLLF